MYKYHHISWFQWKCHVGNMLLSYSNFFSGCYYIFSIVFSLKNSEFCKFGFNIRTYKTPNETFEIPQSFLWFFGFGRTVFFFHVRQYNFILERKPQPLHAPCLRCHNYRFTFCVHTNCMEVSHILKAHILHFIYLHIL